MMRIRANIDVTDNMLEALVRESFRFGFTRVEPRKRWTIAEKKEAARFAIEHIVQLHIDSKD